MAPYIFEKCSFWERKAKLRKFTACPFSPDNQAPMNAPPTLNHKNLFFARFLFEMPTQKFPNVINLVAFHPRPQIASDLGRNVTRSSNPHPKSQAIPERERHFWLMAADSNRNGPQPAAIWESQTQPAPIFVEFCTPKSQPAGRNRRIRAAKAAANRRIAGHKATKVIKTL